MEEGYSYGYCRFYCFRTGFNLQVRHGIQQLFGEGHGIFFAQPGKDSNKLVSAPAQQHISAANAHLNGPSNRTDDQIPYRMAICIIDLFERVNIEQ